MDANHIDQLFADQQESYIQIGKSTANQRLKWLKKLEKAVLTHREDLTKALQADMGKPLEEGSLTELFPLLTEIRSCRRQLRQWMKPKRVGASILYLGTRSTIYFQSRGVCLIISPWNYPVLLTLAPLVSALAAGNTAIIKPSEFTPNTSAAIKKLLESVFPSNHVALIEGGVETSQYLLDKPFHHIFFTGSPRVAKIVVKAAAENLTSVTLELGGKSPTIVHKDADIQKSAERIAFGKGINAGQTCVAPDYILVHESIKSELMAEIQKSFLEMYGEKGSYTSIINDEHNERLSEMINEPQNSEYFPLHLLDVDESHLSMQEEIFGPVLPVLGYTDEEEIFRIIHSYTRPLVMYAFSHDEGFLQRLRDKVRTGAFVINHTLIHFTQNELPFGGVNHSGWGRYHGREGFLEFSNQMAEVQQRWPFAITSLVKPPYSGWKKKVIDLLIKYF